MSRVEVVRGSYAGSRGVVVDITEGYYLVSVREDEDGRIGNEQPIVLYGIATAGEYLKIIGEDD